jgi:hypothetical protein
MRTLALTAAAVGALIPAVVAGTATADGYYDGLTSCGKYSQALYDAERAQYADAVAAGAAKRQYEMFADTTNSYTQTDEYNRWQAALAQYNRSKANTAAVFERENRALCGS